MNHVKRAASGPQSGVAPPPFLALSPAMVRVAEVLSRTAATDVRMVLYGETGTGKTHAAHFLHTSGPRARGPEVRLNLLEPTAAEKLAGPGFLESVRGGTLVLQQVDRADPELQSLLAGLVEGWGSPDEAEDAPVRIVSTGCRDLLTGVEEGWFRRDLYYLLEVFPVALPPLRQRLEEIPLYLEHFARKHAPGRPVPPLPEGFLAEALAYPWPGNLRELENLVVASLPEREGAPWNLAATLPRRGGEPQPLPFAQAKREFETMYVHRLLLLTEGNVTKAADLAGKARKDFYALMARNLIDPGSFRRSASG